MVRTNSPAVCTTIKSKPCTRARRSLSRTSLDVKGSVVMEKVWVFEGMDDCKNGLTTEQLSEEDTGKDDWCEKHCWFLYTNLIAVQQCAKCSKRILTKRAAYKCTECKQLCHLKCAIKEEGNIKTDLRVSSTKASHKTAMDFESFVKSDNIQTCRYTRKTSSHGQRGRLKTREMCNTNNSIEEMETQDLVPEPPHQEIDLSKLSELHSTASSQSQTKQRLNSMKHGFVKRCRSFKNKVKTFKDKVNGENHKSSDDQTIPSSTSTTSSSTQNTADQESEQQKAWIRSPIRTRLREKQLEFRRESVRTKNRVRRNNSAKLRRLNNLQSENQAVSEEKSDWECHTDLALIKGRIDFIEKRVLDLETAIPQELHEWNRLKKKFEIDVHCKDTHNKDPLITGTHRDYIDETHPKHIEALQSGPLTHSASSGTTSDDVYIVPDNPSSSSHEDHHRGVNERHSADRSTRNRQSKDPVMYSPVTSLHDDSLPSGIPHRFRLNMQNSQSSVYTEHQTSTPVTNKEISFRSASKQYESTHTVCHTAVTHVNMDHTYSDPSHNSTSEIKLQQHTSIEVEPSVKVLSPEQVAVKSFLDKRKSSSIGRRSTESGQSLEGCKSPSEFTSPRRSSIRSRSPYNLRSRNSLTNNEMSPKIEANQASFYSSPPIASSTFHENNRYGLSPTDMSPVLYSNKEVDDQDVSDYDEDIRLGINDKNASSASNFSFTFRNDSQMIQTNADEDLPGYTRNYRPNRTTDVFQEELGDLMTEDNTDNNTDKDNVPYETDGLYSKPISHVTFASHESPTVTVTTDDNLSLTNVTAFTSDLGNSFADSGCGIGRSRWINKDVRMFERDEQGNPIRPKISMSHEHIDERGDGGKPPIPRKPYSSHTEIDYLHEAEKRLDMYKTRRSVERSASMDSVEIKEHIAETQFVPETVSKLQHAVNNSPSPKGKQSPYNLRHGDLKTKSRTPSPRKGLDLRGSSSREPSPTNSYSERSRSNSPGKSRRPYRDSQVTNQSEHSPHIINKLTSNIDSTTEFEEIERRLRNESQYRRSQSLTSLKQESSSGKKRQKSMSCTNSVDGETKSIINDSAMYHFLHDKGMIKISSPSLKIINGSSPACRRRYTPECNHIDEESSDMLHSGSESNLSGVIVNNEFHFNDISRNTSEGESRQTRSYFTQTGGESDTCEVRNYKDQEREMLEEYLRTTDENQAEWDNVLSWMNREHNTVSNEEVEQELEMLMEQQETEEYEQHNRTKQNSQQSPVSESLYYSFIGQSEELRGLLSPVRSSVQRNLSYQLEETFQVGPGLMYVITNGSIEDLKNYLNSDRTISESEIKEALKWALDQRNLKVAMLLLEDICKLIRGAEDEMCVDVFPAYLEQDRWQPVIVILTKQQYEGDWDLFMGLPVFRRRYDLVSNEARKVVYSDYVKSNPLNADDLKKVRRAIRSAKLDKNHSNVTIINGCPCRSRQGGQLLEKGLCIVVHCVVKGFIPFDEECFPSEIQGIPVDVREGYFLSGVATPTKSSQTADFVKTRQTETDTDSHVSSDSAGSKCLTGSECDYLSVMTEHKQSVVTYKPTDFEDGDPGEINLAENNEELPAMNEELTVVNGQTVFTEDVINKGLHCAGDNQQNSHRDSLLMGSGITTLSIEGQGQATIQGQGTVGGFVHLADDGMGFITCAHVIERCEDHSNITLQIHNPADQNNGDRKLSHKSIICGEVIKSVLDPGTIDLSDNEEAGGHSETGEPGGHSETGVDAVVVKLTDPSRIQARFINITREQLQKTGYDDLSQPTFTDGQIMGLKDWRSEHRNDNVLKIGATTGLTQGYLYTEGSYLQHSPCVSRVYGSYLLNQLEIAAVDNNNKFFDCGDSGSLVFIRTDQTSLRCVGLAVGCTSYDTCIVTPIETVLHRLNLQQEFVKFEN